MLQQPEVEIFFFSYFSFIIFYGAISPHTYLFVLEPWNPFKWWWMGWHTHTHTSPHIHTYIFLFCFSFSFKLLYYYDELVFVLLTLVVVAFFFFNILFMCPFFVCVSSFLLSLFVLLLVQSASIFININRNVYKWMNILEFKSYEIWNNNILHEIILNPHRNNKIKSFVSRF